jgi:hypothetical protein
MALNGHPTVAQQCLLSGVKRTSRIETVMSGLDPSRSFVTDFCCARTSRVPRLVATVPMRWFLAQLVHSSCAAFLAHRFS